MKEMNILSLFDGMSCGQQAFNRIGIRYDNYFASEIDKYAIKVTQANYPDTIQLGSVVDIDCSKLPPITYLIGGSPCQSLSFAGKRKGLSTKCELEILTLEHYLQLKSDGFEFEGQSYLFWEYMRILKEVKPKYFLLENVEMGKKWESIFSRAIGVNGIHINSSLVSAQNRERIYWTNIGLEPQGLFGDLQTTITQPKDKGIFLKDVLESDVDEKYYLSEKMTKYITRENNKPTNRLRLTYPSQYKCGAILQNEYKQGTDSNFIVENKIVAMRGRGENNAQQLEERFDNKTNSLTSVQKDNLIVHNLMPRSGDPTKGGTGHLTRSDGKTYCLDTGNTNAVELKKHQQDELNYINGKARCLVVGSHGNSQHFTKTVIPLDSVELNAIILGRSEPHGIRQNTRIRRLTPTECERLQTVTDGYTNHVSNTQRYKMLGNGWTVDVIAHILNYSK